MAGWNTISLLGLSVKNELDTLLGPEGTPAWWFLVVTILGLAGLTHRRRLLFGVAVWWRLRGWGVVVC